MMKHMRVIALMLAVFMLLGCAAAETAADDVIAVVNGENVLTSEYAALEAQYLQMYERAGYDVTDESLAAYVQDIALTAAIQNKLVQQDMMAQGCYQLTAETEQWIIEQGNAAYQAALADLEEALREQLGSDADEDMTKYALTYANIIGVSEQDYIDVYRDQYAYTNYYNYLLIDNPVTEEEIQAAYDQRVAESKAKYEHDAAAFETAMYTGEEVWYRPEGYRSVLAIQLNAAGETNEARLANVQDALDAIYARLDAGESFQALMAEYDISGDVNDEAVMASGYQVHRDSVIWDEAFVAAVFSEEMAQPGCWSKPVASEYGVYVLYYLSDSEAGPIAMSDDVHDALAYAIFTERGQAALQVRLAELSDKADVVMK